MGIEERGNRYWIRQQMRKLITLLVQGASAAPGFLERLIFRLADWGKCRL